ncbi:hypothetical protein B0H19DRAFT_845001, partial [Mycena capillaripes]
KIQPHLPEIMPSWGKVRIVDGDSITTASAAKKAELERDSSYVRVNPNQTRRITQVFYGRLERILVCQLPKGRVWGAFSGQCRLLAVLTPCSTLGQDATKGIVSYNRTTATFVTDIQTVSAVVGRIKSRGKWTIVDRT